MVAWAQNKSDGSLVAEMQAHGLNAKPGTAASYKTFKGRTALEELVKNPLKRQATDLDMVSFSNNIGF